MTTQSRTIAPALMPAEITGYTRKVAIAALASQMLIVLTGGLVRLTASGLGCSTWPRCSADALTATPELGIHSYIEFGNRLLTFVLLAVAILSVLAVWRVGRRDLRLLSLSLLLFVPLQALVGMVTVLTHLNPWVVSVHFLVSMPLVMWATQFCARVHGAPRFATDVTSVRLGRTAGVLTFAILVAGTILTGSGPHAGDHGAARTGLDPQVVTPFHSVLIYAIVAVLVVLLLRLTRQGSPAAGTVWLALGVVLAQGVIGYIQHFTGLPIPVVAAHMLGSTAVVAAVTFMNHSVSSASDDAPAAS
ncbi:COX15/CtaA family protein [Falsarthrobacter nasiphocae]|uniref:Cytochrome c oxidase assembly protein subunit 15 n=1 Tax=Falsarthrobacter nasiphocae TaxID=189863 RepID=A0AAE3YG50_9MICC|nr:COX15/CtaA family protein [Falsarthrobacter nasiphocae]MDR6891151.1 cytochrome c oxidase assembly protein subunit 15 [Falsarthrobacter nasiphocae]